MVSSKLRLIDIALMKRCDEIGIDHLVQKPIDINEIDELLKMNNKNPLRR